MAYFSNGESWQRFERNWCIRCAHGDAAESCAVANVHFDHQGAGAESARVLAGLITDETPTARARCLMFRPQLDEAEDLVRCWSCQGDMRIEIDREIWFPCFVCHGLGLITTDGRSGRVVADRWPTDE